MNVKEIEMDEKDTDGNADGNATFTSHSRLKHLQKQIERRQKSILNEIQSIVNDDRVQRLNAAQSADYLRNNLDARNKNNRNFAKRVLSGDDVDVDRLVRKEVLQMHAHLMELEAQVVDASQHAQSFLSLETTMDSIRAVCELVNRNLSNEASVTDIVELLGLVGIACVSPVGTYPDPLCWRVNKLHLGVLSRLCRRLDANGKQLYGAQRLCRPRRGDSQCDSVFRRRAHLLVFAKVCADVTGAEFGHWNAPCARRRAQDVYVHCIGRHVATRDSDELESQAKCTQDAIAFDKTFPW